VSSLAQKNASTDAKLNLCSTSEEKPFMATAEVSLNPVNDLDEQTKGTMKAQVVSRSWQGCMGGEAAPPPSSIRPMPLCGLPPRRLVDLRILLKAFLTLHDKDAQEIPALA